MAMHPRIGSWPFHAGFIVVVFAAALMGVAIAPEPAPAAPAPTDGEFVGRLLGSSDSFIGVVAGQGRVLAFVCNGTDAGVSVWGWFQGDLVDSPATFVAASGLELRIDSMGAEVTGEVRFADGSVEAFTATAATGIAGLFRAEGTLDGRDFVGGWIVLDDGDIRGQVQLRSPTGAAGGDPARFVGTGGFNLQNGTASITDGTSNTIVTPVRVTSEIIAILIG